MNSGCGWPENAMAMLYWQVHLICGMISGCGLLRQADGSKNLRRHAVCGDGFEDRRFYITIRTRSTVDGFKNIIASAIFYGGLHADGDGTKHIAHHVPGRKAKEQDEK